MQPSGIVHKNVQKFDNLYVSESSDAIAIEEPLEIQLAIGAGSGRKRFSLAVTMRTPGHDFDLALGFLFTEGIIGNIADVLGWKHIGANLEDKAQENVLLVDLSPELKVDTDRLSRHFYAASSCGVCGKASIEMIRIATDYYPRPGRPQINAQYLFSMPTALRQSQSLFEQTGGIHAAGLFDVDGRLLMLREDVGRHNALDKLIGAAMQAGMLPLRNQLVLVSGRAGFELVQKCAMAGIPLLAAVGAPSSLAIELADEAGMTLVGFLREGRFNIYCGTSRILNNN